MTVEAEQEVFSSGRGDADPDLVVHSLYSNKEIFLRELISNASDAIDRLQLELLAQWELPGADGPLRIRVGRRRGRGRDHHRRRRHRDEPRCQVIQNIGTIAKSGTREFY